MANTVLKKWNGSSWEEIYPETTVTQIVATGTPSSTTFLRGDGVWATPADEIDGGNADTVDNLQASQFVRSDTSDTMSGNYRIESGSFASFILDRSTTGSGSVVQFENNNGVIGGIGAFGDDGLQFRTKDGTQMVIDASNRVGIGLENPATELEVDGDIQLVRTKNIIFGETPGGNARARIFSTQNEFSADYNGLGFSTGANGRSNPTMYIRSTNNSVGIGTTNPTQKLDVTGNIRASSNMYAARYYDLNNTSYYVDPTSTSILYNIDVQNTFTTRGSVVVDTDTNTNKFYISRTGSTSQEYTAFGRDDTITHIHTKNDESSATVRFRIENTDTESGGGANANDRNIDLISDATSARIVIDGNTVATENYVNTQVSNLVASAPSTLDTLNELAAALGDDANFSTTVTNSIATKLPLAGGTLTGTLTSRAISMQNYNLTGVNMLQFNDPGPNEGIDWSGGNFKIYESPDDLTTNSAGNLQFVAGGQRRMTVGTDGYVYVGSTLHAPTSLTTAKTHITASNPILQLTDSDTSGSAYIDYQGGTSLKVHAGSDPIAFIAGNSEKARITAGNGYLGVGTTNPSYGVDVHANDGQIRAYGTIAKIWAEASDAGQASLELKNTEGHFRFITDNGGYTIYDQTDAADRFKIDTNGHTFLYGNLKVESSFPRIYLTDTDSNSDFSLINGNGTFGIYDDTNSAYRMQINSLGHTTFHKKVVIDTGDTSTDALYIKGTSPTITLADDTSGADDFFIHVNGNNFYVLTDRDGGNQVGVGYETPHPLQLEADTNVGYLFGEVIATRNYVDDEIESAAGYWKQIYSGTATITSGTSATTITTSETLLNQGGQDQTVIAFELNSSSISSYTSQIHIVKLENSNSSAAGVLFNAQAHNSSIQVGSIRVYRGVASTDLNFSYSFKFTNGSSSEIADTVYIGRVWKIVGVNGV